MGSGPWGVGSGPLGRKSGGMGEAVVGERRAKSGMQPIAGKLKTKRPPRRQVFRSLRNFVAGGRGDAGLKRCVDFLYGAVRNQMGAGTSESPL
jgi:hypothetical protein